MLGGIIGLGVVAVFSPVLGGLVRFAAQSDLYSHILIMPFVSGVMIWLLRIRPLGNVRSSPWLAAVCAGLGIGAWIMRQTLSVDPSPPTEDLLFWGMLSFLLVECAVGFAILGRGAMHTLAFPVGILAFMLPFPRAVLDGIEGLLQHGSAAVADLLFGALGAPVFRYDLNFKLPEITLNVAPECSGIHSSLVLLILSVIAGRLFFSRTWTRFTLAAAVIPLALARNGVRVVTIGLMCIHWGPQEIDSPVHHRGGPLFFAASLIPFFGLVYLLRRFDRPTRDREKAPTLSAHEQSV